MYTHLIEAMLRREKMQLYHSQEEKMKSPEKFAGHDTTTVCGMPPILFLEAIYTENSIDTAHALHEPAQLVEIGHVDDNGALEHPVVAADAQ